MKPEPKRKFWKRTELILYVMQGATAAFLLVNAGGNVHQAMVAARAGDVARQWVYGISAGCLVVMVVAFAWAMLRMRRRDREDKKRRVALMEAANAETQSRMGDLIREMRDQDLPPEEIAKAVAAREKMAQEHREWMEELK